MIKIINIIGAILYFVVGIVSIAIYLYEFFTGRSPDVSRLAIGVAFLAMYTTTSLEIRMRER